MAIISGLIVSIDAFFIGISLGLQQRCKFLYLIIINAVLLCLCIIGFFAAEVVYEFINVDTDIIVGAAFISLGTWYILQWFFSRNSQQRHDTGGLGTIALVGLVMSLEAMLITMGITLIFLPYSTFAIPVVVAGAHFGYSAFSFWLARTKHVKRVPAAVGHIVSGCALIIYGLMAIFVEFGV